MNFPKLRLLWRATNALPLLMPSPCRCPADALLPPDNATSHSRTAKGLDAVSGPVKAHVWCTLFKQIKLETCQVVCKKKQNSMKTELHKVN